jgi:two-component system sensor histidine kinase CpxA
MRGLFFKIFILFWIAQSLIFVISTSLILARRMQRQDFGFDPSMMQTESTQAVKAFDSGGCEGFRAFSQDRRDEAELLDATGGVACKQTESQTPNQLALTDGVHAIQVGNVSWWSASTVSAAGKKYFYVVPMSRRRGEQHGWYDNLMRYASPQLPVAIAVGGFTTFLLVLMFTRPVIRLRDTANQLARGRLNSRVKETRWGTFLEGEEFEGLVKDFNHMAERLESLVDAQKLLLRDVSHELRSPLARLSLALELAREDANSTMSTHLDRIERETERLNQLIGQLLTLSSLEASESLDKPERVSLNDLLRQILPDAEYEAKQRGAGVSLHAKCDCAVDGRRELLYRAVENVVRNAIRYTNADSQVEIQLEKDHAGRMALIEVSDRGPGIPESELQSIFRPFYRIDLARASQTGGFGVGLAIAERAIKLHNGRIRASNRSGGGATVQISLPISA